MTMSNTVTKGASNEISEQSDERIIGTIEGKQPGPSVVIIGGIHGNEPAGVEAVSHILGTLRDIEPPICGRLIGIRGNLGALQKNVRYIDEDMNRLWFPSIVKQVRNTPEEELESSERQEMKQLLSILDQIDEETDQQVILADSHSFSADGWMFTITNAEPRQRNLLSNTHVPMVFGIEESLRGTALGYYQKQGFISFGLEGGQHTNEMTVFNMRAALMLLLKAAGCIEDQYVDELREFEQHLQAHTQYLPDQTELVYQHIIEPEDEFEMRPGYKNFQHIQKGEWLASDQNGRIRAQCDGYMLMPLYQDQGDDGFFIIKEYEG